ncbi:MAG: Stealth CR1 domain-containing protein [Tidjanibacter sp.]|nr:Stealth CR1 domain-containing protein [Tidjanibacter sp.]
MERVDLVYLWVDGDDPEWQQRKREAMAECGRELPAQAVARGRFVDNQELRYSLRSVEKYAPWVGKVFIVTADQTPKWLNVAHPKVELVSHSQILPSEYLPTFNSSAIEMALTRIEGLSERFLFANDDMFFRCPVGPEFFYTPEGLPIARFARYISTKESLYLGKVRNAQRLVAERFGGEYVRQPHHNVDAYLKSDVNACLEAFEAEAEATCSHRFRQEGEFHRSAWLYYALSQRRAVERVVGRYGAAGSVWERLGCRLRGRYCTDSAEIGIHRGRLAARLAHYNPRIFCLNDTERASDREREEMGGLLERLYPEKSSFEL